MTKAIGYFCFEIQTITMLKLMEKRNSLIDKKQLRADAYRALKCKYSKQLRKCQFNKLNDKLIEKILNEFMSDEQYKHIILSRDELEVVLRHVFYDVQHWSMQFGIYAIDVNNYLSTESGEKVDIETLYDQLVEFADEKIFTLKDIEREFHVTWILESYRFEVGYTEPEVSYNDIPKRHRLWFKQLFADKFCSNYEYNIEHVDEVCRRQIGWDYKGNLILKLIDMYDNGYSKDHIVKGLVDTQRFINSSDLDIIMEVSLRDAIDRKKIDIVNFACDWEMKMSFVHDFIQAYDEVYHLSRYRVIISLERVLTNEFIQKVPVILEPCPQSTSNSPLNTVDNRARTITEYMQQNDDDNEEKKALRDRIAKLENIILKRSNLIQAMQEYNDTISSN